LLLCLCEKIEVYVKYIHNKNAFSVMDAKRTALTDY
jgi:hypothetical protein